MVTEDCGHQSAEIWRRRLGPSAPCRVCALTQGHDDLSQLTPEEKAQGEEVWWRPFNPMCEDCGRTGCGVLLLKERWARLRWAKRQRPWSLSTSTSPSQK